MMEVVGTVAVSFDGERTYENIMKVIGLVTWTMQWSIDWPLTTDTKGKAWLGNYESIEVILKRNVHSIRIDTHQTINPCRAD